jgi:hypothetical protein
MANPFLVDLLEVEWQSSGKTIWCEKSVSSTKLKRLEERKVTGNEWKPKWKLKKRFRCREKYVRSVTPRWSSDGVAPVVRRGIRNSRLRYFIYSLEKSDRKGAVPPLPTKTPHCEHSPCASHANDDDNDNENDNKTILDGGNSASSPIDLGSPINVVPGVYKDSVSEASENNGGTLETVEAREVETSPSAPPQSGPAMADEIAKMNDGRSKCLKMRRTNAEVVSDETSEGNAGAQQRRNRKVGDG